MLFKKVGKSYFIISAIKIISAIPIVVVLLLTLFISIMMLSAYLSNLYFPIRLYYIGEFDHVTIKEIKGEVKIININNLPKVVWEGSAEIVEYGFNIVINKEDYSSLKKGERTKVFISKQIDRGFFTDRDSVSLFYCLYKDEEHSFLISIVGIILFLILFVFGMRLLISETYIIYAKLKVEFKEKQKIVFWLNIAKVFMPYLLVVSFIYALAILSAKAIVSVEESGELSTGLVLLVAVLAISLLPYLILRMKRTLSKSKIIEAIKLTFKIGLGLWTFIKTIIFINVTDLTKYKSIVDVLQSLGDFIIDI